MIDSAKKNEIVGIIVSKVTECFIQGKIGLIQVLIPRIQLGEHTYSEDRNEYVLRSKSTGEEYKV